MLFRSGRNSDFFYKVAKFRHKLGLKLNLEMIYLPGEVFKSRGKEYTIRFGEPISWTEFDKSKTLKQWAAEVKKRVYQLKK